MMQPNTQAQLRAFDDLEVGATLERDYVITQSVYEDFLRLFGDASPLHVEDEYARACGFNGVLMHGAILNGFVSNFVGMHFPGGRGLELSVDIRFLKPCYVGDQLQARGKIAQKVDLHQVVVMHITFVNRATEESVASARVQIKMMSA